MKQPELEYIFLIFMQSEQHQSAIRVAPIWLAGSIYVSLLQANSAGKTSITSLYRGPSYSNPEQLVGDA
jgi:hypothetical protein